MPGSTPQTEAGRESGGFFDRGKWRKENIQGFGGTGVKGLYSTAIIPSLIPVGEVEAPRFSLYHP